MNLIITIQSASHLNDYRAITFNLLKIDGRLESGFFSDVAVIWLLLRIIRKIRNLTITRVSSRAKTYQRNYTFVI